MRRRLSKLNLNAKVSLLILVTTFCTLSLLAGAYTILELLRYRHDTVRELSALMDTIGGSMTAALRFDDKRSGAEILEALRADPRILEAAVTGESGAPFAWFPGDSCNTRFDLRRAEGFEFELESLVIVRDIRLDNEPVGRIFLRADTGHIRRRILEFSALSFVILVLSALLGFLVSRRLLAIVTRPILALTEAARGVMRSGDYNVALLRSSGDEVGELTDCFSGMLAQIRDRDRELNLHREHLEEQVRVRTAELEAARRKAEEVSRLKSEFLANMSHEIRTPLNGMLGLTALSLETGLPREAREYLEMANQSADMLLTVVNDILDFSKIESGKLTLESIPFHLPRTVARQVRLLALQAHRKNLDLVCEISPGVPAMVTGDPTRLQQVLGNLVANAIKFTSSGEVVIRVAVRDRAPGAVRLSFAVSDTGIGIPAEAQAAIFDAFTQADGSTTRRFGGTGLGLAISRRLVEQMNGEIRVSSVRGQGSTFEFHVLLGCPGNTEAAQPPSRLSGLRALVVDAHGVSRRSLMTCAVHLGMEPEEAAASEQALSLAAAAYERGHPFDVVYCDRELAGAWDDGFVRRLRAVKGYAQTPVLLLSSLDAVEDTGLYREMAIASHIAKPVLLDDLREVTAQALDGSASGPQDQKAHPKLARAARRLRVLVAEDNTVNQRVIQGTLQKIGHEVALARNGREAVERAGAGFDVILMDCQMP
ncbi:MAG TPA: hypothetical protein DEH78_18075, partial [Solibacterales bacterium]|nr:hypothetical protein [Bryobacterales bacterium]